MLTWKRLWLAKRKNEWNVAGDVEYCSTWPQSVIRHFVLRVHYPNGCHAKPLSLTVHLTVKIKLIPVLCTETTNLTICPVLRRFCWPSKTSILRKHKKVVVKLKTFTFTIWWQVRTPCKTAALVFYSLYRSNVELHWTELSALSQPMYSSNRQDMLQSCVLVVNKLLLPNGCFRSVMIDIFWKKNIDNTVEIHKDNLKCKTLEGCIRNSVNLTHIRIQNYQTFPLLCCSASEDMELTYWQDQVS